MSIDGPKIIDSDVANDIYIEFMDLYDSEVPIDKIKGKIEQWQIEAVGPIEMDIYKTAYTQCLWEIGEVITDKLKNIIEDLNSEIYLKEWKKELGDDWYIKRKKNLIKFVAKISTPVAKPRKIKKNSKVKNPIFKKGDLVAHKFSDNNYHISLITDVEYIHRKLCYLFAQTNLIISGTPKFTDEFKINGNKYGSSMNSRGFCIGISQTAIEHVDLKKIQDEFINLGNLNLNNKRFAQGSFCYFEDIKRLEHWYKQSMASKEWYKIDEIDKPYNEGV